MNILMLNYEYPPLGGGAGNATHYLLGEYSRYKDLRVDLITSSTDKAKVENIAPNITIYYLDIYKKGNNIHYQSPRDLLIYSWKAFRAAKKLKKEKRYDLVHAFFGVPCGYIALKLGIPYIVSLRGADVPGHNTEFKTFYFLLNRTIKKTWENARLVIPNSDDLKKESEKFLPLNYKIIPNGVNTDYFRPHKKGDDVFRILYVGRLHRVKNIDLLMRSYARLLKNNTEIKSELLIVGDGPEQKRLFQLAEDLTLESSVKFLGYRRKEELINYYSQASILVLLSENEGMSNTILEAMACGLPVITTPTGGSMSLVNGNGVIVKKDVQFIADKFRELINSPGKLQEMGENSRKMAKNMSWSRVAAEYFNIYKTLCAA